MSQPQGDADHAEYRRRDPGQPDRSRDFNSQADDYDLAPSARRIAFSIHGEIFTAPVEEGDSGRSPMARRAIERRYSPDGKWIAFISDRSGREEDLYRRAVDGTGEPQKMTDIDALKFGFNWSPDSKEIAFARPTTSCASIDGPSKQASSTPRRTAISRAPVWSPDGKWIAYSKSDATAPSDIYLIAFHGRTKSAQGHLRFVQRTANPRFAPDGRKLFFVRMMTQAAAERLWRRSVQIYSVALEREGSRSDDAETAMETARSR